MEHYKPEPTISQETDEDPFQLSKSNLHNSADQVAAHQPGSVWGSVQKIHVEGKPNTREYVSQCIRYLSPPPQTRPQVPPGENNQENLTHDAHAICLVAQGRHIHKAVTCAEIIKAKKTHVEIHQITRVTNIKITETYEPVEGMAEELEPIRVTRTIPLIHILLITPPLNALSPQLLHCLQQHLSRQPNQSQSDTNKQHYKTQGYQKTNGDGRKYSKKPLPVHLL